MYVYVYMSEFMYVYIYLSNYASIYFTTASRRRRRRQGWSQAVCYAGGMINTCIYE